MYREIKDKSKYAYLLGWVRELTPGAAHVAFQGQHFTCEVTSFTSAVYAAAAQKGYKASVVTFPDQGQVAFAFYHPDSYFKPNLPAFPIIKKMRKV